MVSTDRSEHELDSLVNVRDLGGLPTEDGGWTRPGVLYRSDAPRVGDRDPVGLAGWPPRVVVDLRDAPEQGDRDHPMLTVAAVRRVSLLEDIHRSGAFADKPFPGLAELYTRMTDLAAVKLVEAFRAASTADGPALVHCAAGKDRTGVLTALLLRAAGVRREAVVEDYLVTNDNLMRVLQRLELAPILPVGVDADISELRELHQAPREAIDAVLTRFEESGGVVPWLARHGLGADEVARWRARLTG
ncbi:tyrosine-protein phosphatase [Allosaccharopolyspora coralli]|uniref:tyrosine-protein phosphatase n=1 Tax=Allosaccharopolyspora coralli TaxID=2665642 RepID=UPI001E5C3457|nr:tyrosine-protein phosphatase [Allosaccharopolyspora coralli]